MQTTTARQAWDHALALGVAHMYLDSRQVDFLNGNTQPPNTTPKEAFDAAIYEAMSSDAYDQDQLDYMLALNPYTN